MPGYICRKSNLGFEQLVWSRISQYYQVTMARYSHKQHQLQTIWSNYWYSFDFYLDHYSQRCRNTLILLAKIDKRHEKILRVKLWDFNNFLHNLYLLCELYGFHLFLFNLIHEMAEIYKAKMAERSNVLGSFVARKITCPTIHLMLRRLKEACPSFINLWPHSQLNIPTPVTHLLWDNCIICIGYVHRLKSVLR